MHIFYLIYLIAIPSGETHILATLKNYSYYKRKQCASVQNLIIEHKKATELFKSLHTLKLQDINKLQIGSLMQRYHAKTLSPYLMNMFTVNANIHSHITQGRLTVSTDGIIQKFMINLNIHYASTGPALWNNIDLRNFNIQFNNTFKRNYKKFMINKYLILSSAKSLFYM